MKIHKKKPRTATAFAFWFLFDIANHINTANICKRINSFTPLYELLVFRIELDPCDDKTKSSLKRNPPRYLAKHSNFHRFFSSFFYSKKKWWRMNKISWYAVCSSCHSKFFYLSLNSNRVNLRIARNATTNRDDELIWMKRLMSNRREKKLQVLISFVPQPVISNLQYVCVVFLLNQFIKE